MKKTKPFLYLSEKDEKILYFIGCFFLLFGISLLIWFKSGRIFYNTDTTYHLNVAQAFIRAKGVVTWDFWESLPLGRPQNYPPLLHIFLAFLLQIGCSVNLTVKIFTEVILVGGLACFSFFIARLINIKVAFWTLFLLCLSRNFFLMSSIVLPASLVVFLAPALLYLVINRKWVSSFALLVLMFYTHLFMPYIIIFSLLVYIFINERKLLKPTLAVILLALISYMPWLYHIIASGLSYIKYFDPNFKNIDSGQLVSVNIIASAFLLISLFYLVRNRKKYLSTPVLFFAILFFCLLPVTYISSKRAADGHPFALASVLSAVLIVWLMENKIYRYLALPILVFYLWETPNLDFTGPKLGLGFKETNITYTTEYNYSSGQPLASEYSEYTEYIKNNSETDEPIAAVVGNFNKSGMTYNQLYPSIFFGATASRPTTLLRKPEYYRRSDPDILRTRFVFLNIPPQEINQTYFYQVGYSDDNLAKKFSEKFNYVDISVAQVKGLYLYRNGGDEIIRETFPKKRLPLPLAYALCGVALGLLSIGLKWNPKAK